MGTLKIGDNEYEIEKLPDECKAQLISIQLAEQELVRLQGLIAVFQTAKVAYAKGLQASLEKNGINRNSSLGGSDTIKLS